MDKQGTNRLPPAIARELFYALPLALMFLLALTPGISFTEDLGRHLLLGKIIAATGRVPDTNLLTYTCPDFPFINHHWLAEVIIYLCHRAVGLNGLILFKALLMCAALALAMRSAPLQHAAPLVGFAAALSAVALGYRAHSRPELFTYLGVALYGWFIARGELSRAMDFKQGGDSAPSRRKPRSPALSWIIILAYGWLWANAHIYFIFGLGMISAYWLACWRRKSGRQRQQPFRAPPQSACPALAREAATYSRVAAALCWRASFFRSFPRNETLGLLALVGVSLLNPNGWRGLVYPLGIFGNYAMAITENASPLSCWETVLNPMLMALPLLSLCALRVFWRMIGRPALLTAGQMAGILILLAALVAAWQMARSVPLLALTLLPPLGFWAGAERNRSTFEESNNSSHAGMRPWARFIKCAHVLRAEWLRGAGVISVVVLNLWLTFAVVNGSYARVFPSPIGPTPFGFDDESRYLALRRLQADGLPGKIFSDYNSGSLVEYNIFPERGYVDNRPEAFPAAFWQKEYLPALALGAEWDAVIARRGIQTVAVSIAGVKEHFIRALLADPRWRLVHLDFFFAVFTQNTPANQEFLRRHAFDQHRAAQFAAQTAQRIRALSSAGVWRRQVLADQIVYEIYGLICISRNDMAWPLVREMHLRHPDYQLIHELMRVSAPPYAAGAVMEVMARRARWPLAVKQVLDYGAALEAQGRTNEARAIYRRGRFFFPLNPRLRPAEANGFFRPAAGWPAVRARRRPNRRQSR